MGKIYMYEELESTQIMCKEQIEQLNNGDVIMAKRQIKGYGRTGLWDSNQDNLYFSIKLELIDLAKVQCVIALAIYYTFQKCNLNVYLKLPNDVYFKQRKIGGILIEPQENCYVIGIGLNIFEKATENRTSLNEELPNVWSVKEIANILQNEIQKLKLIEKEILLQDFKKMTTIVNQEVQIINRRNGERIKVKIFDINTEEIITNQGFLPIMQYKFEY